MSETRAHVRQQDALGTPRFHAELEAQLERRVEATSRGRPRKAIQSGEGEAAVKPRDLSESEKMNLY